jgi:hypothetical protein
MKDFGAAVHCLGYQLMPLEAFVESETRPTVTMETATKPIKGSSVLGVIEPRISKGKEQARQGVQPLEHAKHIILGDPVSSVKRRLNMLDISEQEKPKHSEDEAEPRGRRLEPLDRHSRDVLKDSSANDGPSGPRHLEASNDKSENNAAMQLPPASMSAPVAANPASHVAFASLWTWSVEYQRYYRYEISASGKLRAPTFNS